MGDHIDRIMIPQGRRRLFEHLRRHNHERRVLRRRNMLAAHHHHNNIPHAANNDVLAVFWGEHEPPEPLGRLIPEALPRAHLFELITPELLCTCSLRNANSTGCSRVVSHCQSHPEDVYYQSPRLLRTPLHEAARHCCCRRVLETILNVARDDAFVLLSATDSAGRTPLHCFFTGLASRRVDSDILQANLQLLLGARAETIARMRSRDGYTPLHYAVAIPDSMCPLALIERLIQVRPQSVRDRTVSTGQTPLHILCAQRHASVAVAKLLLEGASVASADADNLLLLDNRNNNIFNLDEITGDFSTFMVVDREKGYNPLHYAVLHGNTELVELLLLEMSSQEKASLTSTRTMRTQQTPLHIACQHHVRNTKLTLLLAKTALPTIGCRDNVQNRTPLHYLCRHKQAQLEWILPLTQEIDHSILSKALQVVDEFSYLPLHYACEAGAQPELIAMLLKLSPEGATMRTSKQDTPLSLACTANQSVATVNLLLEAYPDAANLANQYGFIPLHCCCRAYQPKLGILQALGRLDSKNMTRIETLAGDCAIHLAKNNTSSSTVVLEYLASVSPTVSIARNPKAVSSIERQRRAVDKSKIANTLLHAACLQGAPTEEIDALTMSNPQWIATRNNAGLMPLQLLCKSGRIDEAVINIFAQTGGPSVFSTVDDELGTPLHSAMRNETPIDAVAALIRAYPEALHTKTMYGDTPLHLACLRRVDHEMVRIVAMGSSAGLETTLSKGNSGRLSPVLMENTAGQTPIGIAMELYERVCLRNPQSCCVKGEFDEEMTRAFDLLATLVKIVHYGPVESDEVGNPLSLIGACVSLHRMDVRLDPAFIRRALFLYPHEALYRDKDGNFPLHIEASIPIEKMMLLDSNRRGCCSGMCQKRAGVLDALLEVYPEATRQLNDSDDFPLSLMIQNGRPWGNTFKLVVRLFPEALYFVRDLDPCLIPLVLKKITDQCGLDTVFSFVRNLPST